MKEKVIGVLGCGVMGSGITKVCAMAGFKIWMGEVSEKLLESGIEKVSKLLDSDIKGGNLSNEKKKHILDQITGTTDLSKLSECSFVIEAIVENIEVKKKVFKELGETCCPDTILASNTSSFSITELASVTKCPERVVGFHFFYPVPIMKLIEIVKTDLSDETAIKRALQFAGELKKDSIIVADKPGFVVNRLLVPYFLDSIRALEEGLASVEDIDKGMTEGGGFVIGPFRLLDHVGLDTIYYIANSFYNEFKERRFAPPPLLKRMVMAGNLGRKTGKGFYTYKG